MKLSLITVVYQGEKHIRDCIRSVGMQSYPQIDHLVLDGGSTDATMPILSEYRDQLTVLRSGPDGGQYPAMNQGITLSTGEVIGFLHADDQFPAADVVADIMKAFEDPSVDAVYGDLEYIGPKGNIHRKWKSGPFDTNRFNRGWMPPHPTLYIRRKWYEKVGGFDPAFGTAADYEFILRLLYKQDLKVVYLPRVIVQMRTGGSSNASIRSRIKAWLNDYRAMKKHGLPFPALKIILKPLRKLGQFRF